MLALSDAEKALDEARAAHDEAQRAYATTKAAHAELVTKIASGKGADVTSEEPAAAAQRVQHAELVAVAAERQIAPAQAAFDAARADAIVDEIGTELPERGAAVERALREVRAALGSLQQAVTAFDGFVDSSVHRVSTQVWNSPRVSSPRMSHPSVDNYPLRRCRGAAQLAQLILDPMQTMGAPVGVVQQLKLLAHEAPAIPTS